MAKKTVMKPIEELTDREIQENMLKKMNELVVHQRRMKKSISSINTMFTIFFVLWILGVLMLAMQAGSWLAG